MTRGLNALALAAACAAPAGLGGGQAAYIPAREMEARRQRKAAERARLAPMKLAAAEAKRERRRLKRLAVQS